MFTGIAIFASVVLWLMVKEKGFRKIVFIGAGAVAALGACVAVLYYGFHLPSETRKAKQEAAAYTTVNLKDGTVLKLKGSNLTPDEIAAGVEKFHAAQGQAEWQAVPGTPPPILDGTVKAFLALDDNKKRETLAKLSDPAKQALLAGIKARSNLSPCPSNDPLGLRSANPCQPPSPEKGAPPCPANDPVGLNTAQPCTPLPPQ